MPKGWRKPEDAKRLEKHEVHALLSAALYIERDPKAFYFFALMYLLALRVGEAVLMRWDYIGPLDETGRVLNVRVPTLKQHTDTPPLISVPVLSHPRLVLAAFNRRRLPVEERRVHSPWLFPSSDPTRHMSIRQAAYLFALCRDAAKLNPRFTPHSLRYAAVGALGDWEVAQLGMLEASPRTATAFLRHTTRTTAETYMVRTTTAWRRYHGALDLPPLRPAAGAVPAVLPAVPGSG